MKIIDLGKATVLDLGKGWFMYYIGPENWVMRYPDENGQPKYFDVSLGAYSPMFFEEPLAGIEVPDGDYVDVFGNKATPNMPLIGVICKDAPARKGQILYRGNLTNFLGRDGGQFGSALNFITIQKDGKANDYRLYDLHASNKNRIVGNIGYYLPVDLHDGRPVEVTESENVV